MLDPSNSILLFDGVCNLCNGTVNFLIDRDPQSRIKYASLQSEAARQLLEQVGAEETGLESVILIEEGKMYVRSEAVLRVARHLKGVWPALAKISRLVPRAMRDVIYNWVARNRYNWFGRQDSCRLPSPDVINRFIEMDAG